VHVKDDMTKIPNKRAKDFVTLLRPHFLLGSIMLFLVGSAYADGGNIHVSIALILAILSALMVQLSGQLVDDYFDRDGDRPSHRSFFAGGSGVIQSGSFSARTVLNLAMLTGALSLILAAIVNVITGRWLFLPLIALGLAGGLAYSMPPVRLASNMFGEVSIAFLTGFVLPLTGSYLIKGTLDQEIAVVSLPLFLFTMESLIAVEFPDVEADRDSGKRNLTFRLGILRSRWVQVLILIACYMVVSVEVAFGWLTTGALLLLITVPFSLHASLRLTRMNHYDFDASKNASNTAMTVNGISIAIMLAYVIFLSK
jgi:1,4-dihydroxy-2-naphthoate polyprenyltransferase